MHSISAYPCPEDQLNLNIIKRLKDKYKCNVGYSGHEPSVSPSIVAVTLGANRTLGAGSGAITGQFVSLLVIQDGTGSRTLSFNAVYEFKDDTAPTLTTTASKGDLFVFRYNGSKFLEVGRNLNLTLS